MTSTAIMVHSHTPPLRERFEKDPNNVRFSWCFDFFRVCGLQKHLSFWVGFFSAVIVAVPIAVGVWGAASEFARNMSILLFGAVGTLIAVLVVVLFLRDWILRRTLGTTRATMEDFANSIGRIAASIASGDHKRLETETQEIAKTALGWYAWSSFYRWVIGSAIGLLLAFGAFTGTVLLFEQNNRLQEQTDQFDTQNEILTLSLASELRLQLQNASEQASFSFMSRRGGDFLTGIPLLSHADGCGVGYDSEIELSTVPSPAIVDAIADLATRESPIRARVVEALRHLLMDSDGTVAAGALLVLDQIGQADGAYVQLSGMYIGTNDLNLSSAAEILLVDSYVDGLTCRECTSRFVTSIILANDPGDDPRARLSLIFSMPGLGMDGLESNIIALAETDATLPDEWYELQENSSVFRGRDLSDLSFYAANDPTADACTDLRSLTDLSLVIDYFEE
ncbi:hypothetical protein [Nioella aestuarii]|uniref:hypothetical protein n=1 Tax=Nioella aestuarii TaxID=1662864 RepID=UPI003D7FBD79